MQLASPRRTVACPFFSLSARWLTLMHLSVRQQLLLAAALTVTVVYVAAGWILLGELDEGAARDPRLFVAVGAAVVVLGTVLMAWIVHPLAEAITRLHRVAQAASSGREFGRGRRNVTGHAPDISGVSACRVCPRTKKQRPGPVRICLILQDNARRPA